MEIRPLLLGHRGARAESSVPENTSDSFDLALAQGCDGFEFDVRLTADGQAVVCHGATSRGVSIAECSSRNLALPRLHDILARYRQRAFLDIELKVAGLEKIAADLLRELAPTRGFVVSSFLVEVLRTLHGMDSSIPLGLICETRAQLDLWRQLPIEYVIPHHTLAGRNVIDELRKADKKILVWTVNAAGDMKRLGKLGVDGIISDNPKLLARTLGKTA